MLSLAWCLFKQFRSQPVRLKHVDNKTRIAETFQLDETATFGEKTSSENLNNSNDEHCFRQNRKKSLQFYKCFCFHLFNVKKIYKFFDRRKKRCDQNISNMTNV